MTDEKKPVPESDQTDPLTLTNLILNKDARKSGYDWVHYGPGRSKSQEDLLQNEPPKEAFITVGEYEIDPPVVTVTTEAMEEPNSAASAITKSDPNIITNNLDVTVVSSDPKFNECPAYVQSICRVDGRPCPFSNIDCRECGKFYLATSGDPALFELPPGREQSQEYAQGIKQ
jgi:hypothetical protein